MSSTDAMKTPGSGAHVRREESETNPFAKHMWMENEEEYKADQKRQEEEERLGEEFVTSFFEELLALDDKPQQPTEPSDDNTSSTNQGLEAEPCKSSLNPEAKEFVPENGDSQ